SNQRVIIHFCVSDTGIGISKDKIDKIFQPFDQADTSTTRRYGGTGLGLSISTRLVELMGGKIWVDSQLGQGSKFHFTLQLGVSQSETPSREIAPVEALQGIKVLVVDDNLTNRKILDGQLSIWGMTVALAENGSKALVIMKEHASKKAPFKVALIDCMMPELDGLQLSSIIRNTPELNGTRIVILSSASQAGGSENREKFGIDAWLVKPVKHSELRTCLLTVLSETRPLSPSAIINNHGKVSGPVHGKNEKILIAEDNAINRTFALRLLQKAGYQVKCAENGLEVLDLLDKEQFDLILMDVSMPELDGYETTRKIRKIEEQTGRHITIIAMTAHALMEDRGRCLAAGMDDYVSKPVNIKELFEKMDFYFGIGAEPDSRLPLSS
ncbi:MAG: response regulator, partial [Deltaproteobacteria bacterium]|nr:response regulator [Deltaproteobacteria bacterium]